MAIAGGAMLGYCAIGSVVMASAPASITTIASTQAKIGRSMKKLTIARPTAALLLRLADEAPRPPAAGTPRPSLLSRASPAAFLQPQLDHQASARKSRPIDHPPRDRSAELAARPYRRNSQPTRRLRLSDCARYPAGARGPHPDGHLPGSARGQTFR